MANSFLAVQAVTADKKLDSETLTVAGNTVERERVQIAGATDVGIAVVSNLGNPDWTQYGLLVKVGGILATDSVHQQGTYMGLELLAARKDAAGTIATTDGRLAPIQLDGDGNVRVVTATLIPGVTATALGKAVDAVAGATDTGVAVLAVRDDVLATLTPVDGDYTRLRTDSLGSQWVTLSHMAQVIGSVAHDGVDTQPPVKIGGRATTSLRTPVTSEDRVDGLFDADGALVTRRTPLALIVTGNNSNIDGNSTELIAAQASGISTYLTRVTVTNTNASTFAYVELKDGTTVKHTIPAPALGGATLDFDPPLKGTAATAWNFDPSGAVTTIICSAVGFTSRT